MESNYYFYVVYCQDNTLYAGYTTNLDARMKRHNDGKGAKYTRVRTRRPVQLIYAEKWSTKQDAMRAEYRFKQLTRLEKERYLHEQRQLHLTDLTCVIQQKGEDTDEHTT